MIRGINTTNENSVSNGIDSLAACFYTGLTQETYNSADEIGDIFPASPPASPDVGRIGRFFKTHRKMAT